MIVSTELVAAHRELVEASDGVRRLLVLEHPSAEQIADVRGRLALAYERVVAIDEATLCVSAPAAPPVTV
jgi:hypothetical protein